MIVGFYTYAYDVYVVVYVAFWMDLVPRWRLKWVYENENNSLLFDDLGADDLKVS